MIGVVITLIFIFLCSFIFEYDEAKALWWIYISLIAIAGIAGPASFRRYAVEFIAGALVADALVGLLFHSIQKKYFDAFFVVLHHFVWGYGLLLLTPAKIPYGLAGQLAISSLDVFSSASKITGYYNAGQFQAVNVVGRLLLGNWMIYLALDSTARNLIMAFNTMIGSALLYNINYGL
jgi:hypothetical protein